LRRRGLDKHSSGNPVKEVIDMVEWAFKHEGEAEFDPKDVSPAWLQRRWLVRVTLEVGGMPCCL
jgi:hypothetical protein